MEQAHNQEESLGNVPDPADFHVFLSTKSKLNFSRGFQKENQSQKILSQNMDVTQLCAPHWELNISHQLNKRGIKSLVRASIDRISASSLFEEGRYPSDRRANQARVENDFKRTEEATPSSGVEMVHQILSFPW